MLDEAAIPTRDAQAAPPSSPIGRGGEGRLGDRAGEGLHPSTDTLISALSSHAPLDAAQALGIAITTLLALVRQPEVQQDLHTLRQLEADHAARQRQAAQALAMQALSEILNKRDNADSDPVEVRRAASALARPTGCHRGCHQPPALGGRRTGRSPSDENRATRATDCGSAQSVREAPDDSRSHSSRLPTPDSPLPPPPNTITNETLSTLATGTVTRVLDRLARLDNPGTARAALARDVCIERDHRAWLTDLQRSRFFAYRKLPRTLDHPDLGWGLATVRVRYRGHEREPTLIRLINRGGPDPWAVHSFRIDSS